MSDRGAVTHPGATAHEIALLRLAAQRIVGAPLDTPAEAVSWLFAAQAQDLPGAITSIALRTASRSRADVRAALDSGAVARTWPMRGTLHLVAAEDLPWMVAIGGTRSIERAARHRAALGLDETTIRTSGTIIAEALDERGRLSRGEIVQILQDAGIATGNQRGYHLLGYHAESGLVCLGPMRGAEQLVVKTAAWIPRPRRLDGADALREFASRYLRSHGPASVKDLAGWAGLPLKPAREAIEAAAPGLARLTLDGTDYWMDPATPELLEAVRARARGVFLLPGFDEFMLGYKDRSASLDPGHFERVVPGRNGVFKPTVVADGRVVGTWSAATRKGVRTVAPVPFEAFAAKVDRALPAAVAALPAP